MTQEFEFHREKLDNGITVIFEKRKIPVIANSISVKFGSQYENLDIKGISHFIEHLVFKGTKKRTVTEIAEDIEKKGGVLNAFTGEEITCFWNKIPSKHFETGIDLNRDLVLNPLFENKSLERERKVILEEIKMYHDNPGTHVLEKMKEMLFKSPFNIPILGTSESVLGLSRKKILETFNSSYKSNNMIFCAVGNANWEEVLKEAKKFPKTKGEIKNIPIKISHGESIEKRKGIDQAHMVMGFHMPKLNDKNRYTAEVFNSILGGGMSSRLFQEIREKRGLCYAVKSDLEQSKDYAYEIVYVGTVKEKIKQIRELILKEIKKLKNLNQRELNEAKERLIGLRQISKEKCDSTMMELLQEELAGNAENYHKYHDKINSVKLENLKELIKLKGHSFVALVPDE